jgi:hypothetical protein
MKGDRKRLESGMDEVKMMVSCVVIKDYRKIVRVSFLRGRDYAEGILPDGMIEQARGFSDEEVQKLENYLRMNRKEILNQAKAIDPLRNWLGDWKKA